MTVSSIDSLVPPPPEIQFRAWIIAQNIRILPKNIPFALQATWHKARNHWPSDLTWRDCQDLIRLHRMIAR